MLSSHQTLIQRAKERLEHKSHRPTTHTPLSQPLTRDLSHSLITLPTRRIALTSLRVEQLLERGVTMSGIYTTMSITPTQPHRTVNEVKREELKVPKSQWEEEVKDLEMLDGLYSSSELTRIVKWSVSRKGGGVFEYPSAYRKPGRVGRGSSGRDGFYVPEVPYVTLLNYDVMLRRLLETEGDGRWFDGERSFIVNGWETVSMAGRVEGEVEFGIEQVKAGFKESRMVGLVVYLGHLDIYKHPLLSEEDHLSSEIKVSIDMIHSKIKSEIVPFLSRKVESLLEAYQIQKDEYVQLVDLVSVTTSRDKREEKDKLLKRKKLIQTLHSLQEQTQLMHQEIYNVKMLEYRVVKSWDSLKTLRSLKGFSATPLKVSIRTRKLENRFDVEVERLVFIEKEVHLSMSRPFNEESCRLRVMKKLKQIYNSQPNLEFFVSLAPSTPLSDRPLEEQVRLSKLENDTYYLLISYGGCFIQKTDLKGIQNNFKIQFDTTFMIYLTAMSTLKADLYQVNLLGDTLLGSVFIPIPKSSNSISTNLDRNLDTIQFSSSDYEFGLNVNISYSSDKAFVHRKDLSNLNNDQFSFHGPAGLLNLPKMIEWLSTRTFDPNDPRNADLLRIKELIDTVGPLSSNSFFRVGLPTWLHRATLGVGPLDATLYTKRFDTLVHRFLKTITVGVVPLFDNVDVIAPNSIRDSTESQAVESWDNRYKLDDISATDLGFLKRVRELQVIRKGALLRPRHVDDFVVEARVVQMPDQQLNLFAFLRPNRPLNPYRDVKVGVVPRDADHCKLVIQLLQGLNLPTKQGKLRPFVELSFQKHKARSSTADGSQPLWNQRLSIDVEAPNGDFRPEALLLTDLASDVIFINLFDEIVVDLLEDERERLRSTYVRRERVWLGAVEIPFTTVWQRSRVDGKFKVKIPKTLLGYSPSTPLVDEGIRIDIEEEASLHIFITLDPPLKLPPPLTLKFVSDENRVTVANALKWQEAFSTLALTNDMTGKSTLIMRYIRPQNQPAGMHTALEVARFVSMIPVLPTQTVFAVQCHLWATSDQLLDVGAGDSIEHAILLCNYLLHMDYKAYVVMGSTLIDGKSAFVILSNSTVRSPARSPIRSFLGSLNLLSREGDLEVDDYQICNPTTGIIYDLKDKFCPILEINSVFNQRNIWVNLQTETSLDRIQFDFNDSFSWRPFLTPNESLKHTYSIQPAILHYKETTSKWILDLERKLEKMIIIKFEGWRKGQVTRWNRLCSRTLKVLSTRSESDSQRGLNIKDSAEISSLSRVYKLTGHPICMAYTDGAAILNAIYNVDLHSNITAGVEFALAVHCHGFPGNFVSIQVFLCSLSRL